MYNIWIIAKRELKHYFISPIAYVLAVVILVFLGLLFTLVINDAIMNQYAPSLQPISNWIAILFLFATPAITMRTLAEEQRTGTLELLLTAPIRDWELVVGKWLGSFILMALLLAVTWVYPIILNQMVSPGIDQGLLISQYFGLLLLTSTFIAIGVLISSLFSNQIAAFITSLGVFLFLWILNSVSQNMTGNIGEIVRYLGILDHFFNGFQIGVIQLKDAIYYLSATSIALFLGTISIEIRRWK